MIITNNSSYNNDDNDINNINKNDNDAKIMNKK